LANLFAVPLYPSIIDARWFITIKALADFLECTAVVLGRFQASSILQWIKSVDKRNFELDVQL